MTPSIEGAGKEGLVGVQEQAVDGPAVVEEGKDTRPIEEPPSRYTPRQTKFIVYMVAVTCLFRYDLALTNANIYFPAIPTLTGVFHKSTSSLNLTVTVYLILQAIAPMVWGPVSDYYGRRPTYLICFAILVFSSLGLALVPTNAFWLLLLLRCFQSAGCSNTTALCAGVIGDITSRRNRGGHFFSANVGSQLAPVLGPVLGGALAGGLGWRSIFWFLCILSGICLVLIFSFLPETCAAVEIGDSKVKKVIYSPVFNIVGKATDEKSEKPAAAERKGIRNPLPLFLNPAVALALAYTAMTYSVWYCVTATISSAFAVNLVHGRVLDAEYRRMHRKWATQQEADAEKGVPRSGRSFPVEHARLRLMPLHVAVFSSCVIGWGWAVQAGAHLAIPLVLQLPVGYTSNAILNTTTTLMIDIEHARSSSVTACTNLARCSLAAVMTAVIDYIIRALGYGWTYVLMGGVAALTIPLFYLEMIMGPRWRESREARAANA
ncbi:MFS general substrate transporter [Schizophyllum commune H4-8]|uniref:MFS general substrate transporter n=1 Tax=Schizophyllum commune (strain H4-8 / FGSC 9210) TaxID=578458 RepID=UPI0021602DCE|nr:MFS general substrate transporter [Schizophyllum commune H4-8]KAI5896812.1 MFS general substrate transporter [Schizophyllum commune H4-8]